MKIRYCHSWEVSVEEARRLQETLRTQIDVKSPLELSEINVIAGADVSFQPGFDKVFGAVVLMRFPDMEPIETAYAESQVTFPYIPGYLSFREVPVLLGLFEKLTHDFDVLLCDAQGLAHPRRFGLACHLGLLLDKPTIGCAKTRLVGEFEEPGWERGSMSDLREGEEIIGRVVRTRSGVKPLFVSVGHKINLESATEIVLATCKTYRLPEPLRLAHQLVNKLRRQVMQEMV